MTTILWVISLIVAPTSCTVLLCGNGPYSSLTNNTIGSVQIPNQLEISFDITVHSLESIWTSSLWIGELYKRYGTFFARQGYGFLMEFNAINGYYPNGNGASSYTTTKPQNGSTYNIRFTAQYSQYRLYINDNLELSRSDIPTDPLPTTPQSVYVGYHEIGDYTVSNIAIQQNPTNTTVCGATNDPTNNPTVDPTIEPTTDPSANPTDTPTNEPTTEPTKLPSSRPTGNPAIIPTKSPTKPYCDLKRLNITIRSFNVTQFVSVINRKSQFQDVVKNNIIKYYQQPNDDTVTVKFDELQSINNNSLAISYDVMNCNPNIQDLNNYLNSSTFNSSLTKTLDEIYQNFTNKKRDVTITYIQVRSIWSYLPPPLELEKFDINSPVSIVIICIFVLILIVIIIGYFQSKCYGLCSIIGCKLTDNFNPSRVIFFVLAVFVLFNNLNTSYAYFYEYSIYIDTTFITLGCISVTLIILNIIYDGLLIKSFENDIEIAMDNKYVDSWLKMHRYKLIFLVVISGSFYHSLSLVNSNVFGCDLFRMRLSYKQLLKFKTHKIEHILISSSQLIVHTYSIFYIVNKRHSDDQIAYLSIFSIIGCLFNVLSQIITRCSSSPFQYETMSIDVRIDVDDDNDKIKLQKQKDLTKHIKNLLAKMLEVHPTDIEIIDTKESLSGIIISCIKYDKIVKSTKINNKNYELASIELQKSLLDDDENTDLTLGIESQLSSDKTKRLFQELYGLNNMPINVCYDVNIRLFSNTFTKSIST